MATTSFVFVRVNIFGFTVCGRLRLVFGVSISFLYGVRLGREIEVGTYRTHTYKSYAPTNRLGILARRTVEMRRQKIAGRV